jgi:hypothetical protein
MMTDATKRYHTFGLFSFAFDLVSIGYGICIYSYIIFPVSFLGGRRTAASSDAKHVVTKPHPFVLSVYSSKAVRVKKLPCDPPSLAIGVQLAAARGQVQHLG